MNNGLNIKECAVYDAILGYAREWGYPPTIRELCEMTGIKSTSTMYKRLDDIKRKGYIDIVRGCNRTIVLKRGAPNRPVLCKYCRYHHKTNMGVAVWMMCHRLNMKTDDDFFCAYGEEK